MLERNVEIRQDTAISHQRDDIVDVRIWIDVVQPHPGVELRESVAKIPETCAKGPSTPKRRTVFEIDAVSTSVLRDH